MAAAILMSGCSIRPGDLNPLRIIPDNLVKVEEDVRWLSHVNPVGVEARPPSGVNAHAFRFVYMHRGTMVGAGLDLVNVLFMRDSDNYISVLSPYLYYSPVAIAEPTRLGPDGRIVGMRMKIMTFLYAGGGFIGLPRSNDLSKPTRRYFDVGLGATWRTFELKYGYSNKFRRSEDQTHWFWYIGAGMNLFGGRWKLIW